MDDFLYPQSDIFEQKLDRKDFESLLTGVRKIENLRQRRDYKEKVLERKRAKEKFAVLKKEDLEDVAKDSLSEVSLSAIVFLAAPLLIDTTSKVLKPSFLNDKASLFPVIYYAGISGIEKGVNKYNSDSDTGVSIHYIIRWFKTYAERELEKAEADTLGLSFSKFIKVKKIAAVRMRLERERGCPVSNEEVLSTFISGQAEKRNEGKDISEMKVSDENRKMTIEDIIEQENAYKAYFLNDSKAFN